MTKHLRVHAIRNNWPDAKPRQPLVHLMLVEEDRDIQSCTFHPRHAPAIIKAIRAAAKAATDGRKDKTVTLDIPDAKKP